MRALIARAARFGRAGMRRLHGDRIIAARAFDRAYYLDLNPDVAAVGFDPLDHFLAHGWREGRNPNAEFSVRAYLEAFPEVAASGVNPFVHYLTSGRPKIVPAEPPLGFRFEVIQNLVPLDERVRAATKGAVKLSPDADLAAGLARARDGLKRAHVTFSHDAFVDQVGGLQLTIGREAARLESLGRDHLHIHPARAWPVVRTKDDPGALGVALNGRELGTFAPATIARALAKAAAGPADGRSFAIHSLLGHAADETADILAALGLSAGVFWLHDFASLCAGFHLQRNDVEDCGAPPPDSAACGICIYGPWRARHTAEHARLFQRLQLTVAAPSQVTLDLWRASSALPHAATAVLPHATLKPARPAPLPPDDRPFRLAYAGLPVTHKGWPLFRSLFIRYANDPRYEFVHLGARRDEGLQGVAFREVRGGPRKPLAMKEALAAEQPDAVLVWPLCRETFSFVAYEAVAAGCAVITGPDSGNVAAFVTGGGHGRVLDGEAALVDAFETGAIRDLSRAQRRPVLYDLAFSALTLDLPAR